MRIAVQINRLKSGLNSKLFLGCISACWFIGCFLFNKFNAGHLSQKLSYTQPCKELKTKTVSKILCKASGFADVVSKVLAGRRYVGSFLLQYKVWRFVIVKRASECT